MRRIAAVLLVAAATSALELPSYFKICHNRSAPNYTDCIATASRDAIISMAGGLKSFKILPLEPLEVDAVKIGASEGSVALSQEYHNIKVHGLTKGLVMKVYKVDLDKLLLTADSFNPQVDFVADYKIEGQILVLPIRGSGKCNITMYDVVTHITVHGETYEKKGETYFRIKKYQVGFAPGRVALKLENLFGGDSALGEQMNKFMNENSDLVFKELQAPYEETFSLLFAKIGNQIFDRVPMNKLFPP